MTKNLKPRKCRRCKREFAPKTEWQKFCSALCKGRAANEKKAQILRQAQKIIDQQDRVA